MTREIDERLTVDSQRFVVRVLREVYGQRPTYKQAVTVAAKVAAAVRPAGRRRGSK